MSDRIDAIDDILQRRLSEQIGILKHTLDDWRLQSNRDSGRDADKHDQSLIESIQSMIDEAEQDSQKGHIHRAWTHCHAASRRMYRLMETSPKQLQNRADMLRFETLEKLTNWRREAVLSCLDDFSFALDGTPNQGRFDSTPLIMAQELLDGYFSNVYYKMEIAAYSLKKWKKWLMWGVIVFLSLAMIYQIDMLSSWLWADESFSYFELGAGNIAMFALLGALGASLSRTLTTMKRTGRIPRLLHQSTDIQLRLLVGAASALAITLWVHQGYFLPEVSGSLPVVALLAGFSDQLVSRAIDRTVASANS